MPRARLQILALPEGTQVYLTPHRRAGLSLLFTAYCVRQRVAQGTSVPMLRHLGALGTLSCLLILTV